MLFARVKQINLCHSFQTGAAPPPARVGEFAIMLKVREINIKVISRFFASRRVQCSIALAAVNRLSEKISPKNEIITEKVK